MTTHTAVSDSPITPSIGAIPKRHLIRSIPERPHGALSKASRFLGRNAIGGRFSIIDDGPVHIQMEAGMMLHVRTGSVAAGQFTNGNERHLLEGEWLVADREGLLTVHSHARSELQADWPMSVRVQ